MKEQFISDSGSTYTIDPEELTCTCPQWQYRCRHFTTDSDRRLCKHLNAYFDQHPERKPIALIRAEKAQDAIEANADAGYKTRDMFDPFVEEFNQVFGSFSNIINRYSISGDYRRLLKSMTHLDYVIECTDPKEVLNYIENVLGYLRTEQGDNWYKYSIFGMVEVIIHVAKDSSEFIPMLFHYTGGKDTVLQMTMTLHNLGYTLNKDSLIKDESNERITLNCEEDLYDLAQLSLVHPWHRN